MDNDNRNLFLYNILDSNIDKPFDECSSASTTDFDNESGVKVHKSFITIAVTKYNKHRLFGLLEKAARFGCPIHVYYRSGF